MLLLLITNSISIVASTIATISIAASLTSIIATTITTAIIVIIYDHVSTTHFFNFFIIDIVAIIDVTSASINVSITVAASIPVAIYAVFTASLNVIIINAI